MQIQTLKKSEIAYNIGQIKGVPKNPRFIRDVRFEELKKSLLAYPDMLTIREIVVVQTKKGYVAICGNQRLRACLELGIIEVSCKVLPANTNPADLRGYALLDNEMYGETDKSIIHSDWSEFKEDFEGLGIDFNLDLPIEDSFNENDIIGEKENKSPKLTITFKDVLQLQKAEIDIQKLIDEKYNGAYFSVSAGEI